MNLDVDEATRKKNISDYGNYWFVKDLHPYIYDNILKAERLFHIDIVQSANQLRQVIDSFFAVYEERLSINVTERSSYKLNNRKEALNQRNAYSRGRSLAVKLANGYTVRRIPRQNTRLIYPDDLVLGVENEAHHINERKVLEFLTKENLLRALKYLHGYLLEAFVESPRIRQNIAFDENLMPIENYLILKYNGDFMASNVRMYRYIGKNTLPGEPEYAIIYRYKLENARSVYLERGGRANQIAGKNDLYEIPGYKLLSEPNNKDNKVIAYELKSEPVDIKTMCHTKKPDAAEIKRYCVLLATFLHKLHNSLPPVFHRAIDPNAIVFTSNNRGVYTPLFINIGHAKIQSGEDETVLMELSQLAVTARYSPPEGKDRENMDWGKYDVYALGVLFRDLLDKMRHPEASTYPATGTLKELYANENDVFDDAFWKLLERMNEPEPRKRVGINEVVKILAAGCGQD